MDRRSRILKLVRHNQCNADRHHPGHELRHYQQRAPIHPVRRQPAEDAQEENWQQLTNAQDSLVIQMPRLLSDIHLNRKHLRPRSDVREDLREQDVPEVSVLQHAHPDSPLWRSGDRAIIRRRSEVIPGRHVRLGRNVC